MQYCKRQILSNNGTVNEFKKFSGYNKRCTVEETEVLGKFTPLCFTFLKTPLLHYVVFTRKSSNILVTYRHKIFSYCKKIKESIFYLHIKNLVYCIRYTRHKQFYSANMVLIDIMTAIISSHIKKRILKKYLTVHNIE